ncbi:hypothetical protein [Paenibacillus sp. MBLB4367]|uniref:hypothetical protein n=1 Tax=Paenibacillus sp. MBLB4367 TaxID=3384767 RepID=UPI003907F35B
METKVKLALKTALGNWNAMSNPEQDDAESTANDFEASFYRFIDAFREWVYELEQTPETIDDLFDLPFVQDIINRLPAPLYLNFETEAELILDKISRVDEDKYD